MGAGARQGFGGEGAEKDAVSLEVLSWDVGPEFPSFARPADRCVVLPLPRLAMRSMRMPAVFPLLCLV